MKKIICIALALVMLLGLAVSASAYDIEVKSSADGSSVAGHTYDVYQIFTGDLEELAGTKVLTNVKYGANYVVAGKDVGDLVPETELDTIAGMGGEAAAEYFNAQKSGTAVATLDDDNGHKATDLAVGYYLIIDVTPNLPENETASAFILEVTDNVTIKSKHTTGPKTEKKIDDNNDSNYSEAEIQWHDSADHDIGDDIPFKLEMTVPSAFQMFKDNNVAYPFTFHDTEEDGLKFNNDAKVYVDNVEITTGFSVDADPKDGHSFDVIFADLTAIASVNVGSKITVLYTSELTEDAVLGSMGNVNEVFGEFRNYYEPTVPVFTPVDTVIAFTYKVVVNKVDENGDALSGATFTLEKFVASSTGTVEYPENSGVYGEWVAKSTVETEPDTVFTFKGLDDGYYRLTEDKAPDGYNKIDPIEFEVTASHEIEWKSDMTRTNILTDLSGNKVVGEIEFEKPEGLSTLSTDVENKSGTVLPETGGVGTTIFYFLGAAMAICAVVVLVSRRRMTAQG